MKKNAILYGLTIFMAIFLASCNMQRSEADVQENLAEIREEKREIIHDINEAINLADVGDISEFKNKAEDALNKLDNQIDDYHNEMDRADRRIDKDARASIINMKQLRTAIEFRLDLLDDRDQGGIGMTDDRGTERTGDVTGPAWTGDGPERTDQTQRTDRIEDRTDDGTAAEYDADDRTAAERTDDRYDADDRTAAERTDDRYDTERSGAERTPGYFNELVDEIVNDLEELKSEIEQFMTREL
jgi:transcription termination factor NusB